MREFDKIQINRNNKKIAELDILKGSLGPDVIDIRNLHKQTGFLLTTQVMVRQAPVNHQLHS
ncbi:MAG: hypothetical protein CM15mP81_12380 [Alphaproteobacteria bacterium]|nr:MAG: hypothetical protein CM15mP81_12380 [Alphaproteobacteria bacterium]